MRQFRLTSFPGAQQANSLSFLLNVSFVPNISQKNCECHFQQVFGMKMRGLNQQPITFEANALAATLSRPVPLQIKCTGVLWRFLFWMNIVSSYINISSIRNQVCKHRNEKRWSPVLHRVRIVELLNQHVVRGDFWIPTNGNPPCWWWGYHSVICIYDWFEMGSHFSPSLIQLG